MANSPRPLNPSSPVVGAKKSWVTPTVVDLPRLEDITLQTVGIPGFASESSKDGFRYS